MELKNTIQHSIPCLFVSIAHMPMGFSEKWKRFSSYKSGLAAEVLMCDLAPEIHILLAVEGTEKAQRKHD